MAKTDTLNIRIEPELKKEVEITLNDLGMNIADAVTIFLKQVVMTESIPFIIKKPKFSDEMLEDTKKMLKMSLKNGLDNNVTVLNNYEFNVFDNLPLLEERINLIDKVTKEDVIKCAKSIKLNTVYVQMGDGNE